MRIATRENRFIVFLLTAMMVILCAASGLCETIFLKTGRRIEGHITYSDDRFVFLTLIGGGQMVLQRSEVESIVEPTPQPDILSATTTTTCTPTAKPLIDIDLLRKPTATSTPTSTPTKAPTPKKLRKIKHRLIDKQEHRTLLARRFVYHVSIFEDITDWEAKELFRKLMKKYLKEEKYAEAIKIRFYSMDPKGKRHEWSFAVADYAPYGNWEKTKANMPQSSYVLRVKIHDKVKYYKL